MTQPDKMNARRFRSPQQRMIALWLLRVLVPTSNFRILFNRMGYAQDEIAEFLCLPDDHLKDYEMAAHEQMRRMLGKFDKGGDGLPDAVRKNMAEVTRILKLSPEEVAVLVFFAGLKEFPVLAEMIKMMTRKNGASHAAVIALALGLPKAKMAAVLASELGTSFPVTANGQLTNGGGSQEPVSERETRLRHTNPLTESEMINNRPTGHFAAMATTPARGEIKHGSVFIAAITSCTNTSNPPPRCYLATATSRRVSTRASKRIS